MRTDDVIGEAYKRINNLNIDPTQSEVVIWISEPLPDVLINNSVPAKGCAKNYYIYFNRSAKGRRFWEYSRMETKLNG